MDYIGGHLDEQMRTQVELHLQHCIECKDAYEDLLATSSAISQSRKDSINAAYYSTILPRVHQRLGYRKSSSFDYGRIMSRIIMPVAASILFMLFLIKIPSDSFSRNEQVNALHQAVNKFNADEVIQAVSSEYTTSTVVLNQEVASAGVEEHLKSDQFIREAVSKQIDNEDIAEMEIEGAMSELNGEQVDKLLSGLSERIML